MNTLTKQIKVDELVCNDSIEISAHLKSNPSIYTNQKFAIQKAHLLYYEFMGENGKTLSQAKSGINGVTSKESNKFNGSAGENGEDGLPGGNGEDLLVYLRMIKDPCSSDSLIEIHIQRSDRKTLDLFYIDTQSQIAKIQSIGGNGGTGSQGGNGGVGATASVFGSAGDQYSGNAGSGGDAGNGGNGGNGGVGGSIFVYYEKSVEKHLNKIILLTYGGKGGHGGNPGLSGKGGAPINSVPYKAPYGREGHQGQLGANGYDGRDGSITFILIP